MEILVFTDGFYLSQKLEFKIRWAFKKNSKARYKFLEGIIMVCFVCLSEALKLILFSLIINESVPSHFPLSL